MIILAPGGIEAIQDELLTLIACISYLRFAFILKCTLRSIPVIDSETFMDWMKQTLIPELKRRRDFRCRTATHPVHLFQSQAVVERCSAPVEERGNDEGAVDLDTEGYAMECIEVAPKGQNEGWVKKSRIACLPCPCQDNDR
jgi:hypothetical protein